MNRNWNFVIAAYAVTWVFVLGYWSLLHRAVRRARAGYERATASQHPEAR